eukprot:CAMPEP_0178921676 /NCGR_PEP_ID=MMETSP0786-20121207/15701_1 /TAXON_ID=186022 /ORGANISM="Thalassionema frauenfeldii, Strain CCMP 1798" /LENGTH=612 /DNA_ID=CAMNT_0020595897 /DNA_START=133 /DNA_END=1971 /DNA_ORIENTATION=-
MISSIEWVPKGVADPTPKKYELSPAEMELLEKQAELEAALHNEEELHDKANHESKQAASNTISDKLPKIDPSTLPPELRMDEYTDDEEDNKASRGLALGKLLVGNESEILGSRSDEEEVPDDHMNDDENDIESDGSENDDEDDLEDVADTREYMPVDVEGLQAMGIAHTGISIFNEEEDDDDDDDDSDALDVNLSEDDAILVVAKTEDDFAALEVHVYEEKTGNLFVHHDIPLPSFPLCLAHGDINAEGGAGNYIAVGTFSPGIEVWNLDILNALEPSCVLGGEDTSAADELMKMNMMLAAKGEKQKNKQLPEGGLKKGSHTDAVMSLSWNKIHRQVIASGSADHTVKIWDITKADGPDANAATFFHHKDKVQSVAWHPSEGTLLATASYDRTVALLDARSANEKSNCKKVKITADVESIAWDPHHSQYLTAATEDGVMSCWDVRNFNEPIWSFVVEEYGGVSDFSYNPNVPGMLATCSINKTVTLWDTYSQNQPSLVPPAPCGNKSMEVGKLFTLSFYESSPWLLACGGGGNELALWDMTRDDAVQKRFKNRQKDVETPLNEEDLSSDKTEDFEAMMAARDDALEKVRENAKKRNNKKKGKKKKGTHKRGR